MRIKLTTDIFKQKASEKHKYIYNYDKSIYINSKTKLIITCPFHGDFNQLPNNHLSGFGCMNCGRNKTSNATKYTNKEFIDKCIIIHNNIYSYEKTIFTNIKNKIIVICKDHGEFEQVADSHLHGSGCKQCAIENRSRLKTLSNDNFIINANTIHHNKYNYELCDYKNSTKKIKIKCDIHGIFLQTPQAHLAGCGCYKCGRITSSTKQLMILNDFIERSKITHTINYNYEYVILSGCKNKITIVCPTHGQFQQYVQNHINGGDCPKCTGRISKIEQKWLDTLNISLNCRQQSIKINNISILPDAYIPETNTIYEFYGDFWHGNPKVYNQTDINSANKKSFGELYQQTIKRENLIRSAGYNLITKWEYDFKNEIKNNSNRIL